MKLYSIKDKSLSPISHQSFSLEKEIQEIVESNLTLLFNLELVKSELRIKNFRVDSLGFDRENKSFVIIEYKKDKNFSVIDQGYTYLSLMLNNKSDFILEYNENCNDNLRRDDIDWSQSRVIFISPQFTEYQKNSVNFKDVPFELWEIKRYQNGLVGFNQHKTTSEESISTIQSDTENLVNKVTREVKVYSEEFHFEKKKTRDDSVVELYGEMKNRIKNLGDDIEVIPRKDYISFRRNRPFCDFVFYTDHLKMILNLKKGELDDPKNIHRDLSEQGHWGNGDYEVKVFPNSDLDYMMMMVKQSYKKQGE